MMLMTNQNQVFQSSVIILVNIFYQQKIISQPTLFFLPRGHTCFVYFLTLWNAPHQILTENTNCSQIRLTVSHCPSATVSWQLMMLKCLWLWCAAALSGRLEVTERPAVLVGSHFILICGQQDVASDIYWWPEVKSPSEATKRIAWFGALVYKGISAADLSF